MQYPSSWIKNETISGSRFATFDSPQTHTFKDGSFYHVAEVLLGGANTTSSLSHMYHTDLRGYRHWNHFHLINSNLSSTLAGQPAYIIVGHSVNGQGVPIKSVAIGTLSGSKLYWVLYNVDEDQYSNYFPTFQQMINSFEPSIPSNSTSVANSNVTQPSAQP